MLTDVPNGTATYESPISLGKILRKVDIKPKTSQAELFADGQSVDTAANTASYDLTFDTSALPLEYVAYLFGHKIDKGVMTANKDDVPPYFAVMFQSDKRNGKKRFTKFFKDEFSYGYAINAILSAIFKRKNDHVDAKILHGRCFIWKKDYESIYQKALAISAPVSDR